MGGTKCEAMVMYGISVHLAHIYKQRMKNQKVRQGAQGSVE